MQRENSIGRARKFTLTSKYTHVLYVAEETNKATWTEMGDVCIVKPGAPIRDGDQVLVNISDNDTPVYGIQFYRVSHGKKYAFRLADTESSGGGSRHMAGGESIIIGPVTKIVRKGEKSQEKKSGNRIIVTAGFNWPYFGIHKRDSLVVETSGATPIGKLIRVKYEDGEGHYINRVCSVKGDQVRIASGEGESYEVDASLVIGPVVEIRHINCIQPKLEALYEKLAQLRDDTDHTLNLTRAFEVEKEIYDLEHPLEEEADDFEWPEVIGDE